jgi:hypothetical protein
MIIIKVFKKIFNYIEDAGKAINKAEERLFSKDKNERK